jgi:hypothetical protein
MPGADIAGYVGFHARADNYYLRIFGSAVLTSLASGGMSYAVDLVSNNDSSGNGSGNSTIIQDERPLPFNSAMPISSSSRKILYEMSNVSLMRLAIPKLMERAPFSISEMWNWRMPSFPAIAFWLKPFRHRKPRRRLPGWESGKTSSAENGSTPSSLMRRMSSLF